MRFFRTQSVAEVRQLIDRLARPLAAEEVSLSQAWGRVLAEDVRAPADLPPFDRGMVDGYAVRAEDTFGASAGLPAYLTVIGEVLMGEATDLAVGPGEAVKSATGGMLPRHANAVVMVEHTNPVDETLVEILRPVAPGENVIRRGEDVKQGEMLLRRGQRLRPQDLGALAGLGILRVQVAQQPRVALIPTGDEIVPPDQTPGPGQIRDINTYSLAGLVGEAGGLPVPFPIVPDEASALRAAVAQALAQAEIVLISGGSSVGARDVTLDVLLSFPGAELHVHGVAVRPGKPTILVTIPYKGARNEYRVVFGLPGNPVSVMVTFDLFVRPLVQGMLGLRKPPWERLIVKAKMRTGFASDAGREEYVRVRLVEEEGVLWAEPVLGTSALISTMVKADGLVTVPEEVGGMEVGEEVEVTLF